MSSRVFDADGAEISFPLDNELEYVCEIGGYVDETLITLSVHSEHLDRDEVTTLLGVQPTKAWNPGERHPIGKTGRTRVTDWGKWLLQGDHDNNPVEPKILHLLQRCTPDFNAWHILTSKYDVWLTIVGYFENWNRELDLSPEILRLLAERQLMLKIDVYFTDDEKAPI